MNRDMEFTNSQDLLMTQRDLREACDDPFSAELVPGFEMTAAPPKLLRFPRVRDWTGACRSTIWRRDLCSHSAR